LRSQTLAILVAPEPGPHSDLAREERALAPALSDLGWAVDYVPWTSRPDWTAYRAVLIRETWDYHLRLPEFLAALERIDKETVLWNALDLVRWNADKCYLLDQADQGVRVVPTVISQGVPLAAFQKAASSRVVAKPAVSASAYKTFLLEDGDEAGISEAREALAGMRTLMQPFVPSIQTRGETSLIYFDGVFSHAMRKTPGAGDFRVQEELGGASVPVAPSAAELVLAQHVLKSLSEMPLFARVDLVLWEDQPALLELELIEPVLFLSQPGVARRFAEAVVARLSAAS
jgi:glutathione synthase/RimK-type ligase-like ATP-grasp enzyme